MTSRLLACLLISTAALSLSGCLMQEKTFGESLDEASAGTQIKTALFGMGPSRFGEVDVEVADRFVLLSGRVPTVEDKAEAERVAWSVRSVDEVANELVIDKFDFGRDVNDRWITEQIRASLIAAEDIKGLNYNIQVYNGAVYLLGLAQSEDELRKAADIASRVKGVQKVVSYVKLRQRGAPTYTAPVQTAETQQPVQLAPPAVQAAPVTSAQPTTRGQYTDPYAPGAAPPPGARNENFGLQSSPLPPVRQ